jgi:hypothetical protein
MTAYNFKIFYMIKRYDPQVSMAANAQPPADAAAAQYRPLLPPLQVPV